MAARFRCVGSRPPKAFRCGDGSARCPFNLAYYQTICNFGANGVAQAFPSFIASQILFFINGEGYTSIEVEFEGTKVQIYWVQPFCREGSRILLEVYVPLSFHGVTMFLHLYR